MERIEEELQLQLNSMAQGRVVSARSALVERGHEFEPINERKDVDELKHMISEKKEDGETIGESQINKALSENGTKRKSSDKLKSKSKKKKFGSLFKTSVDEKVSDHGKEVRSKIKESDGD